MRTFRPGEDERAVFEALEVAFADVWGRPRGTFGRFLSTTEGSDPSLWFLATEGGEIAGVLLGKTVAGEGWVDVVGVRRPWRRRGLGFALLRHAFGEYRRQGVRRVEISVDAGSVTGAPRLYGWAGMRTMASYVVYQRALTPGEDPCPFSAFPGDSGAVNIVDVRRASPVAACLTVTSRMGRTVAVGGALSITGAFRAGPRASGGIHLVLGGAGWTF